MQPRYQYIHNHGICSILSHVDCRYQKKNEIPKIVKKKTNKQWQNEFIETNKSQIEFFKFEKWIFFFYSVVRVTPVSKADCILFAYKFNIIYLLSILHYYANALVSIGLHLYAADIYFAKTSIFHTERYSNKNGRKKKHAKKNNNNNNTKQSSGICSINYVHVLAPRPYRIEYEKGKTMKNKIKNEITNSKTNW